jgi:hypothetical protein
MSSQTFKMMFWWAKSLPYPIFYHSVSSWKTAKTKCICLTKEHKIPPIMGHMQRYRGYMPWFYFYTPEHLFSDLMWNLNIFLAVLFMWMHSSSLEFLCTTLMRSEEVNTDQKMAIILQKAKGNDFKGLQSGNCWKRR